MLYGEEVRCIGEHGEPGVLDQRLRQEEVICVLELSAAIARPPLADLPGHPSNYPSAGATRSPYCESAVLLASPPNYLSSERTLGLNCPIGTGANRFDPLLISEPRRTPVERFDHLVNN